MAAIHDLINQVPDERLRARLQQEWEASSRNKKFGLVFEPHLPELLPLPKVKPRRGDLVCMREGSLKDLWRVRRVANGVAFCIKAGSDGQAGAAEQVHFPLEELLVVRQFGEPIFPALVPVDQVQNGGADSPWHTLIEADNFHALQLLDYLYSGKVDCIYIDPPYNSGARDWKYNNNYVDGNDSWRHSKWLAFMDRRLRLACRLLDKSNSTLIVAIDDNELFSLGLLLDEIFPSAFRQIVNVTINPKGKARDGRLSQVDEYLIVTYIGSAAAAGLEQSGVEAELRWPYLRRSDVESARGTKKGGVRQFYPIYVDTKTEKIVRLGEALRPEEPIASVKPLPGCIPVFPVREDGKQMNWGLTAPSLEAALSQGYVRVSKSKNEFQPYNFQYVTAPSIAKISTGEYRVSGHRPDGSKIVVIPDGRELRAPTSWKKNTHDANSYGSQLIGLILPGQKFPFPKSIYSVFDVLKLFTSHKKNALILDFFAGSGTTLNAVNLLNACDDGQRRCILVTNNEVSAEEADGLRANGFQPGDVDWEALGISRSVTWPRSKFTILGRRDDGSILTGDYLTGKSVDREKARNFTQVGFVDPASLDTVAKKKQLVALIDGLPQTLVKDHCPFIVSDDHKASVLFDASAADDWLEALDGQDQITDFYIVTPTKRVFDSLRARVEELLGPLIVAEEEKRPMSDGFPTNLAYFKLDFLEKDRVALKQAFRELLPILWLKAGAIGPRPELPKGVTEPIYFDPPGANFAVLLDEGVFGRFVKAISKRTDLRTVYIVTDADEAFKDMAEGVRHALRSASPNVEVVQLYKDYLANFLINTRLDHASTRLGGQA